MKRLMFYSEKVNKPSLFRRTAEMKMICDCKTLFNDRGFEDCHFQKKLGDARVKLNEK